MFNEFLALLTHWIELYPLLSGGIVFLVAMIESLAIIGFFAPGAAVMIAFGALISNGVLDPYETILWAALGASTGDALSFMFGWHYNERIYQHPYFKKNRSLLDNGHRFFEKYGIYSVLIGRFVGPIRAVIPMVAGILSMPIKKYIPINIIASALWAPAYLFPGYLLGLSFSELQSYLPSWLFGS